MTRPSPPPEAVLLRVVREARQISMATVAQVAGISVARVSQIENGFEVRSGEYKPVRAKAGTAAWMAFAVGLSPERLEGEGERPDAALVLQEILRQEQGDQAARPARPRFDDPEMDRVADAIWSAGEDEQGEILSPEERRGFIELARRNRERQLRGGRDTTSRRAAAS